MGISNETLACAQTYTDESLAGAGAVAGVPCQIQSIAPITGGNRVTFLWIDNNGDSHTSTMDVMNGQKGETGATGATGAAGADGADGVGIKSMSIIEATRHVIVTYTDDTTEDLGVIPQVQADWNENDSTAASFIKNKPSLGTAASKDVANEIAEDNHDLPDSALVHETLTSYQTKDLASPISVGGVSQTTVEGALGAIAQEPVANAYMKTYGSKNILNLAALTTSNPFTQQKVTYSADVISGKVTVVSDGDSTGNVSPYIMLPTFDKDTSVTITLDGVDSSKNDYLVYDYTTSQTLIYGTTEQTVTIPANHKVGLTIRSFSGKSYNETLYPMVRFAGVGDNTFAPYVPTNSQVLSHRDNGILGAKNLLKNIWSADSYQGFTTVVNADGTISISGSNSQAWNALLTVGEATLPAGSYKIHGAPLGAKDDATYWMHLKNKTTSATIVPKVESGDVVFSLPSETTVNLVINIDGGYSITGTVKFEPMITLATDSDTTYRPYAMTNKELTNYMAPITGKYVVERKSYRKTIPANNTKTRAQLMKDFYDDFVSDIVTQMGSNDLLQFLNGSGGSGGGPCRMPYPFSKTEAAAVTVAFSDVDLTTNVIATYEITFTHDASTCTSYDNRVPVGSNVTVEHHDRGAEIPTSGDMVFYFCIYKAIE